MERNSMTVAQFAKELGVSSSAIYFWRNGQTAMTRPMMVRIKNYIEQKEARNKEAVVEHVNTERNKEMIMPNLPSSLIKDIVVRYMTKRDISYTDFANHAGISPMTLVNFIKDKAAPQDETVEKIRAYLIKNGELGNEIIRRYGDTVKRDTIDNQFLSSMGIKLPASEPNADPDMEKQRNQWRDARFISTIVTSDIMSEIEKKALLSRFYPRFFTHL